MIDDKFYKKRRCVKIVDTCDVINGVFDFSGGGVKVIAFDIANVKLRTLVKVGDKYIEYNCIEYACNDTYKEEFDAPLDYRIEWEFCKDDKSEGYSPVFTTYSSCCDDKVVIIESVGDQEVFGSGEIGSLSAIPENANSALIHVWDAAIIYTVNGDTPSTYIGHRVPDGGWIRLESRQEIDSFQFTNLYADKIPTLYVHYST